LSEKPGFQDVDRKSSVMVLTLPLPAGCSRHICIRVYMYCFVCLTVAHVGQLAHFHRGATKCNVM